MKIKVWALVLIIVGSLFVGAAGMFVGLSGVMLAGRMLQNVHARVPQFNVQVPNYNDGSNNGGGNALPGRGYYNYGQSGNGNTPAVPASPTVPALPADLPAGFNAGVNIESTYAAMTNRTVEQVQAAEQSAGTDVWGLANQEGKLNDLKTKVTDAVTASLKQMVTDKKITQEQSDSYLNWVNQYLQTVGQNTSSGMMPGYGRGWQRQVAPNANPDPGSKT